MSTATQVLTKLDALREQNAVLLAAAKTAYSEALHPGSVVALALLEAIRAVEPNYPARTWPRR